MSRGSHAGLRLLAKVGVVRVAHRLDVGEEVHISAFDLAGQLVWKATNGPAWKGSYPGSRAACTFSAGKIYHMNSHGQTAFALPVP